jgi:RNA polymerase sigma factor (sigma-70 family)
LGGDQHGGSRDGDAYAWLFEREYPPIVQTVFSILGDRQIAEDVVQEAFVRLHLQWRKVRAYDRPGAWVRRVAIRLAVRSVRTRLRRSKAEERAWTPPAPATPADLDLRRAVLRLPRAQRAAVVLHYLEDRPVDEIADLLGCTTPTAKVHLHRARKRLGAVLRQEDQDASV